MTTSQQVGVGNCSSPAAGPQLKPQGGEQQRGWEEKKRGTPPHLSFLTQEWGAWSSRPRCGDWSCLGFLGADPGGSWPRSAAAQSSCFQNDLSACRALLLLFSC